MSTDRWSFPVVILQLILGFKCGYNLVMPFGRGSVRNMAVQDFPRGLNAKEMYQAAVVFMFSYVVVLHSRPTP